MDKLKKYLIKEPMEPINNEIKRRDKRRNQKKQQALITNKT